MLRPIASFVLACALFITAGCDRAPTHESVMEDSVEQMEEFAKLLSTVKDESSANAAKPKLKELGEKMKASKAEMDKLGEVPADKQADLKKSYEDRMSKAMSTLFAEMTRISTDPKLSAALGDLEGFGK